MVDGGSVVHRGGCVVGSRLMGSRVSLAVSARKIYQYMYIIVLSRFRISRTVNRFILAFC